MTKDYVRKLLQENKFVRIDGLKSFGPGRDEDEIIGAYLPNFTLGTHSYNDGICAVVTTDKEVWIKIGDEVFTSNFFDIVAPNGRGIVVSYPDGGWPSAYHLLCRVANPDYQP